MAGFAGAPGTGEIVTPCRGKSKHRGHFEVLYARWADSASEIISGTAMEMIVTVFFVEHSDGPSPKRTEASPVPGHSKRRKRP
jgi:hypothetical protein